MKEIGILWRRIIETKFGRIDRERHSGVLARPHRKRRGKRYTWEGINFVNVSKEELVIGRELVSG